MVLLALHSSHAAVRPFHPATTTCCPLGNLVMLNRSFQALPLSEKIKVLNKETNIQYAEVNKTYLMLRCQTAHSPLSITITARKQTKCVSGFNNQLFGTGRHTSLQREHLL